MMKKGKLLKSIRYLILVPALLFTSCSVNEEIQDTTQITDYTLEQVITLLRDETSPKVLVTAHRAMHLRYPENSLAAIRYSIENGVDIIEIDVRTTKDGRLVLMHDSDIDRMTDGHGEVKDLTWQELQQVHLKPPVKDTAVYRIPLLQEALEAARGKIMVDLDMKGVYVKPLVEMVKKTGTEKQVLFFHSDTAVLDSVLLLDSTLLVMPRAHNPEELKKIIDRFDAEVIHIDDSFFTPGTIRAIKNDGARAWINALGKPDKLARRKNMKGFRSLAEGGAGIIQTDLPVTLNIWLTKEGKR